MNSLQLWAALQNIPCDTIGVYAADEIPTFWGKPAAIIANTDDHTKPGTHWVAMYVGRDGVGHYFDSYGLPPIIPQHLAHYRKNSVVDVADTTGEFYSCRIVLDAGSQSNFISEYCCNKLKLPKNTVNIPIKGIGETLSHVKSSTSVLVKSRVNAFKLKLNCLVIPRLTDVLPPKVIDRESLGIPKNLNLADPGFDKPSQIDILIGAEYFYHLLCVGQIRLKTGSTILQKTKFGWIVAGRTEFGNSLSFSSCHISRCSLDDAVQRFWEIEELPVKKTLSPEDENCEQYYKKTIERLPSGRYSVRLPFNEQKQELGESYGIAVKRLLSLERRLNTNLKLRDEYHNFLQEYQSLGHMTEIREPIMQEGCFLPHHSVIKESSVTTKLRVVFDASAKTTSGVSLNDTLFKGPVVQQDLFSIVLRFRLHDIVFTADIQKMYRQVLVHPDDHKFQRILWRNNSEEAIRVYELNTVTHGTSVAPYLATRTLIQLAENERQNYTDAVEIVTRDMYVDDLLTGTETLEQAKILKTQITKLLSSGGFELRQWASNHPQLIESQSAERQEHWCLEFSEMHKTLGILWNPQQDNFLYHFTKCQDSSKITKRLILSQIASYYDPLGLVGPVTVKTKILLQNIWKLQLSWDETVPIEIHTAWKTFQESMSELNNISFPRHVCLKQAVDLQLHGFADASEVAYGACVYMRSANAVNAHQVMLICSKSRVAPIKKKLSLPKLELCAALLLSQLCQTVLKAFHVTVDKVVLWSDSTIVLHWIHTHPYRLKTFVANRVTAIQEAMTSASWRHVSSQDNPADLLSRGIFPLQLINCTLWIHGPTWLSDDEQHWPKLTLTPIEIPEQRTTISLKTEGSSDLLRRFSSLVRLRRVVAWCLRFINNCRSKHKVQGNLISSELEHATSVIIKLVQSEAFSREIQSLEAGKTLKNNSKILSLHPFLDSIGILRVGGRLVHAKLNYDQRYQILLPGNHYITELIIQNAHISQLHAGPQTTLYHVRQKFWPVNAKGQVKKIFNTLIIEIEAILNSRPLTPLSSSPDDLASLTPSHFLIGGLLSSIPEVDFTNTQTNKLSQWQHIQKLKRDFWNRWSKEYLTELTQRTKWKSGTGNLNVGDLVLLREDKTPSLYWPLGRVTELYPGQDGIVRVIAIRTANGNYKRAVKNVALLPMNEHL
ncbi:PREDICTED: uncharacterized protein LOC108774886 [Cyphomyrmex costatus]|uniref:uncharacterized protein LOC108774886 n=1 Tax=Cyphomyrmex costatus TaxID=456900 RepID=UPI0008524434|nr:PREDICTED: uncharacterized protein LOC108774886 [Cyphomyrmex costatus]